LIAIEAARRLSDRIGEPISLTLHGASDFQTDAFKAELAKATENAPFLNLRGRYGRDEMAMLMADADWVIMPSIWWENAPLTIGEAQFHGRPVIASGIGGMAELVSDGVNGLHVRPNDPADLAAVMRRCAEEPDLWRRLAGGIAPPPTVDQVASRHIALFQGGRGAAVARVAA
jgi:glycosyltransferase involved in cell wall biosynthesis